MTKYAVIDTETSGLFDFAKPADAEGQPRLASLAMILLDEKLNEALPVELFVKPDGWEMSPEVAAINGLTTERLNEVGRPVGEVLKAYTEVIDGGYVIVAFNSQFDTKIMRGEMRRAGIDDRFERTPNVCVMRASTDIVKAPKTNGGKGYKFPKLAEAAKHFGITLADAHSALGDCRAAAGIFRKLHAAKALPDAEVHYAKTQPSPVAAIASVAPQTVGSNNPPAPTAFAGDTMASLSQWMADHPVIQTREEAKEAKLLVDRAKAALDEMETERDAKVRPLNEQVATINIQYKALHNSDAKKPGTYDKIFAELKARLSAFLLAEEAKKEAELAAARAAAFEAERLAREAEAREAEALNNAAVGELAVDVEKVTQEADSAFSTFERASRFAAVAERDSRVKIAGGFGKAVGLRTVETLIIDDAIKAVMAMGVTDKIKEAILSSARDYRSQHERLPDGVSRTEERKL